jgi:hypothetical protein
MRTCQKNEKTFQAQCVIINETKNKSLETLKDSFPLGWLLIPALSDSIAEP